MARAVLKRLDQVGLSPTAVKDEDGKPALKLDPPAPERNEIQRKVANDVALLAFCMSVTFRTLIKLVQARAAQTRG